jgi:hypothetical protein
MADRATRKANSRLPYTAIRQAFIMAWDKGGDKEALTLLKQKESHCPQFRATYRQAFDEVQTLATKVIG